MKLAALIRHLEHELVTQGNVDTLIVLPDNTFAQVTEIICHPLNQEEGSWGENTCFIKL